MRAEDILPGNADHVTIGGVVVRKGTIGAFIANVQVWRDEARPAAEREEAAQAIRDGAPTLRATGLLDILAPRDPALAALLGEG